MTKPKRKCITITTRGKRCGNDAKEGSEHCGLHPGVKSALQPLGRYYCFRFNPESLLDGLAEENPDMSSDDFADLADDARMNWLAEEMSEMTSRRWELVDDGTLDTCTRVYLPHRSHGRAGHRQALKDEHDWLLEHCSNYYDVWPQVDQMNWAEETVFKAVVEQS